jgi:hypothetical protein
MIERPILFSAPMVRALPDGSKTQTRRVIKLKPHHQIAEREDRSLWPWMYDSERDADHWLLCPHGKPGDQLWVRETWGLHAYGDDTDWLKGSCTAQDLEDHVITYRADWGPLQDSCHWRPSIHMPRAASRITLEITGVRVERLQSISEADAIAEGIEPDAQPGDSAPLWREYKTGGTTICPINSYRTLWESINGPGSWDANPWVWVVEFRRIKP